MAHGGGLGLEPGCLRGNVLGDAAPHGSAAVAPHQAAERLSGETPGTACSVCAVRTGQKGEPAHHKKGQGLFEATPRLSECPVIIFLLCLTHRCSA